MWNSATANAGGGAYLCPLCDFRFAGRVATGGGSHQSDKRKFLCFQQNQSDISAHGAPCRERRKKEEERTKGAERMKEEKEKEGRKRKKEGSRKKREERGKGKGER